MSLKPHRLLNSSKNILICSHCGLENKEPHADCIDFYLKHHDNRISYLVERIKILENKIESMR